MKLSPIVIVLALITGNIHAQISPERVEIIRDAYGVPHIYAPTDPEVAYGLAWAHSEDDFQTIQLTLLGAKGMLGQHLGKRGASVDYVVQLLDCQGVVKREWNTLSEEYQQLIKGYTQGINSYARNYPEQVLVDGSFPVTVEEVLSAYVLSLSVISDADKVIGDLVSGNVDEFTPKEEGGSNAFAFARSKTADDFVYLNINSHQPLEGPSSWYEAHLISDDGWNMMGGLFPGAATIFHGTNEHLGWAHTVNYPDKIDVFELEMHPENELKYQFDNGWKELEQKEVMLSVQILFGLKIKVKKTIYRSIYGPVVKNDKGYFAFDLGALHDLRAPEQWYRMNKANNWDEFRDALTMVAIPGFNIVYADGQDNIYYLGNAKIPDRNPSFDWSKTLPGNTSETLTSGYHKLEELPQVLNPKSGFVFNTNNSAFSCTSTDENPSYDDYDFTMGYQVFENNRSMRFLQLVEEKGQISWADFLEIKYDGQLPYDLEFPLDIQALFQLEVEDYPRYTELLTILQTWDGKSGYDNLGAAQFVILYNYLKEQYPISYLDSTKILTESQIIEAVGQTQKYLKKYFKRVDIRLGDYQFLVRGTKVVPVNGIPDVITAMHSEPYKNGRVKAVQGESYIMLVRYPEEGLPIIETVNVFGASNQSDSPHYDDQMLLFVNQKRKKMTLDLDEVRRTAERIYHPQ
ncbi:MAG: peptidase S45 [Flammeovirgaceae bacterium]|nr:peptidase S45 [Flammeovirgaceae bacterium]HCX22773.1 peptidase S45 [Cytophagales bacterium]|tara:strand:+ start:103 stop:2163 length:2061 start_codon:yes stop_codon:yes gene_type:complete